MHWWTYAAVVICQCVYSAYVKTDWKNIAWLRNGSSLKSFYYLWTTRYICKLARPWEVHACCVPSDCRQWRTQEFWKVLGIALRGACLLMGSGRHILATGWYGAFLHAKLKSTVSGARVGRVLLYVCSKCDHPFPIRRLHEHSKAKGTRHALNARMLGTPLAGRCWDDVSPVSENQLSGLFHKAFCIKFVVCSL